MRFLSRCGCSRPIGRSLWTRSSEPSSGSGRSRGSWNSAFVRPDADNLPSVGEGLEGVLVTLYTDPNSDGNPATSKGEVILLYRCSPVIASQRMTSPGRAQPQCPLPDAISLPSGL